MTFVTLNLPFTMTGALVTMAQPSGAKRFVEDCKVNPMSLVGQPSTIEFAAAAVDPAGLAVTPIAGGGTDTSVGENAAVLSPGAP